jgi:hypothetical protein
MHTSHLGSLATSDKLRHIGYLIDIVNHSENIFDVFIKTISAEHDFGFTWTSYHYAADPFSI